MKKLGRKESYILHLTSSGLISQLKKTVLKIDFENLILRLNIFAVNQT